MMVAATRTKCFEKIASANRGRPPRPQQNYSITSTDQLKPQPRLNQRRKVKDHRREGVRVPRPVLPVDGRQDEVVDTRDDVEDPENGEQAGGPQHFALEARMGFKAPKLVVTVARHGRWLAFLFTRCAIFCRARWEEVGVG